jgi:hypothetical protein
MSEVAMLCWDRPNENKFHIVEQAGGPEAAQVYFHLMQGKRLTEADLEPLVFSGKEVSGGVWPDFVDLTAGLYLHSPKLVETLTASCESSDEAYQFFKPRWNSKPNGLPNYKICNLLDLRRDAFIEDKVMLTPDDPEASQGRVSIVDKAKVDGAKNLIRLKAGRVIAVQPLLGILMEQGPTGIWFRNRVRWSG